MIVLRTTVMDDYGILALLRSTIRILMIHSNQDWIIPHDTLLRTSLRCCTTTLALRYHHHPD
jgi:hypothetical protein